MDQDACLKKWPQVSKLSSPSKLEMTWERTELQVEISLKSVFASSSQLKKKEPNQQELRLKPPFMIKTMESTM
jgi:hypothetical protein